MVTERRELQGERLSRISLPKRQVQNRVSQRAESSHGVESLSGLTTGEQAEPEVRSACPALADEM
jgi:hypothetical protein